jgi:hypothetical protein
VSISKEVDRLLPDWVREARRDLHSLARPEGNWGYKKGAAPSVEPSVLSWFGLLATGHEGPAASELAGALSAARWIAEIQRADGSLPVSAAIQSPGWTTPLAMLFWSGLPGFEASRRKARNWLLRLEGRTLPKNDPGAKLFGHDSTAVGWPWVQGTHSWLEPTAMAILALCREGLSHHPRVEAGTHFLVDRSLKDGGWNYGNTAVMGRDLRPQPGPSGVAMLALAALQVDSPECRRGIDYLRQALKDVRSGTSLGWGVLALRAWEACPRDAERWLAESYHKYRARPDQAASLGLLLLAAAEAGVDMLVKTTKSTLRASSLESSPVEPKRAFS